MSWGTGRARQALVVALFAMWFVLPALLFLARWPQWWVWIAPEQTPMTWLQSAVLVLAAAAAGLNAHLLHLVGQRHATVWLALAAGFCFLALDERFALHERVRDGVLAPRGVTVPFLPWVAPGDFLLILMGLAGLLLLPWVWRAVGHDTVARAALVLGVGLAGIAVAVDSIDPATWTVAAERVQQTAEEVVEFGGGLALFACVGLRLLDLLGSLAQRDEPPTVDGGVPGPVTAAP